MSLTHDNKLRALIDKRMGEVFGRNERNNPTNGKQKYLIQDAAKRGMSITTPRLSRYLKGELAGLTEDQILWVATRLGVFINVGYGKPVLTDGMLRYEVSEYKEEECLSVLSRIFPSVEVVPEIPKKKKKKK